MDTTQREQTEEKIQWLSRYRKALRRQQLLAMDLEQARGMVLCHAPAVDGMPRASGHSDRTGRAAERLMRAETRCAAAAADTHRIRSEVQWSISTVFDPTQRELLRRHNRSVQDVVVACGLDRSYGYQLFNGTRKPTRNFLLRLALLLKLGEAGTQRLLKIAERQPLYARNRRDAAVLYGLTHNLTADETQELLAGLGEEGLE